MESQVLKLNKPGFIDNSLIFCNDTPVIANTKQNNPKSLVKSKFNEDNHPQSDPNCKLGVNTTSNAYD